MDDKKYRGGLKELTSSIKKLGVNEPNVLLLLIQSSYKLFPHPDREEACAFYKSAANQEILEDLAEKEDIKLFEFISILKENIDKYSLDLDLKAELLNILIQELLSAQIFKYIPGKKIIPGKTALDQEDYQETFSAIDLFYDLLKSALELRLRTH